MVGTGGDENTSMHPSCCSCLTVYNNLVEQKIYKYKTYFYGVERAEVVKTGGAGENTGGDVENTVGGG